MDQKEFSSLFKKSNIFCHFIRWRGLNWLKQKIMKKCTFWFEEVKDITEKISQLRFGKVKMIKIIFKNQINQSLRRDEQKISVERTLNVPVGVSIPRSGELGPRRGLHSGAAWGQTAVYSSLSVTGYPLAQSFSLVARATSLWHPHPARWDF